MTFAIHGLDPAPFAPLFALSDAELGARHALRRFADDRPGFPCRVSLDDAAVGEELVLVHFEHHAVASPYRASGPVFVRRTATRFHGVDEVPPALASRLLSVRAYDAGGLLRVADVVDGSALAPRLGRAFDDALVAYIHVHFAKPGCFACRVDRA